MENEIFSSYLFEIEIDFGWIRNKESDFKLWLTTFYFGRKNYFGDRERLVIFKYIKYFWNNLPFKIYWWICDFRL